MKENKFAVGCEISPDVPGWHLIHDRLKSQGRMDLIQAYIPAKNWVTSRAGGPRKQEREDMKTEKGNVAGHAA
jgi:hypothetical protein